jgi:hypothetical protein
MLPWLCLRAWRLLLVVDRHVVELPAVCMRALLGESQRLAVFRHRAHRGTDGRAGFRLSAVEGQRIHPLCGHRIDVRVAAHGVGFAIVLEGQGSCGFLTVRRSRLYGHCHALRRFNVSSRLALGRRAGRERRFPEIQFPRPDYSVRRERRARPDCKNGSDQQSFEYGLHLFPRKWLCSAPLSVRSRFLFEPRTAYLRACARHAESATDSTRDASTLLERFQMKTVGCVLGAELIVLDKARYSAYYLFSIYSIHHLPREF